MNQDKPTEPSGYVSPCTARNPPGRFVPIGEGGNNTLALMRWLGENSKKTLAIAADEDEQALHVVDVDTHKPLTTTKLSGKPARVLIMGDGRIVVSLSDVNALEILEPEANTEFTLTQRCLVETPMEPMGLTLTPDHKTLLVTTRWEPTLSIFDAASMKMQHSVPLPRDPVSVLAARDGKRAFVTHAAGGVMSVVEFDGAPEIHETTRARITPLTTSQILSRTSMFPPPRLTKKRRTPLTSSMKHDRIGSQGFVLARSDKSILAPLVTVEPKPPAGGSSGYGSNSSASPVVLEDIVTIDEATGEPRINKSSANNGHKGCFLPRAAAIDEQNSEILVACLGLDAIVVYDASKDHPSNYERRRIQVPSGPTGIAIDNDERRAVVFSSFAGQMTVVPLAAKIDKNEKKTAKKAKRAQKAKGQATSAKVVNVVLPRTRGMSKEIALGRALFHASGRRNVALDGRACASCHPDGRDDGLTWQTPEGPRQTPMLLGRLSDDTAPFGWLGDKNTLPAHFERTIERLSGMGLKDSERDAIFAYVKSLSPPQPQHSEENARVAKGRDIFESSATGCSSCHLGEATTDGATHDVKSAQEFEASRHFETPSLRFIARTAPYFHDGRYGTLLEMVQGCDGKMGTTNHLSDGDKTSLVAYLETL